MLRVEKPQAFVELLLIHLIRHLRLLARPSCLVGCPLCCGVKPDDEGSVEQPQHYSDRLDKLAPSLL
jgi:hypothetical protein